MDNVKDFIAHHGVKGMHWGFRKGRAGSGKITPATAAAAKPRHGTSKEGHLPEGVHHVTVNAAKGKHHSPDAARYKDLQQKVHKHSVHSLTNEELKHLTTRFDLEQKYSKMAATQREKKKSPVGRVRSQIFDKARDTAISEIGQALGKKGGVFIISKAGKAAAAAKATP